jgi:hypothetical protein
VFVIFRKEPFQLERDISYCKKNPRRFYFIHILKPTKLLHLFFVNKINLAAVVSNLYRFVSRKLKCLFSLSKDFFFNLFPSNSGRTNIAWNIFHNEKKENTITRF